MLKTKAPKLVRFVLDKALTEADSVAKVIETSGQDDDLRSHLRELEKWINKLQKIYDSHPPLIEFADDTMLQNTESSLRRLKDEIVNLFACVNNVGMQEFRKPCIGRIIGILHYFGSVLVKKIPLGGQYLPEKIKGAILQIVDQARNGKNLVEKTTALTQDLSDNYLDKDKKLEALFHEVAEGKLECLLGDIQSEGFKAKKPLLNLLKDIDGQLDEIFSLSHKIGDIEAYPGWDAVKVYIGENVKSSEVSELRKNLDGLQQATDAFASLEIYSESIEELNFASPYFW